MMMDATQQISAANSLMELWQGILPDYETPEKGQFLAWVGMHSPETATFAINRVGRKVRKMREAGVPMDIEHIRRYVTGVVRNQRDGRHVFVEAR